MDGIHDMGGMQGFGRVSSTSDEAPFHEAWEGRVHAMVYALLGGGVANVDAFRHAIERIAPREYLGVGYYGRWVRALETLLVEHGHLRPDELAAHRAGAPASPSGPSVVVVPPSSGVFREIAAHPRFAVGDDVRVRNLHPAGHTRLPGYVRGHVGAVSRVHRACVLPDTNAHGQGECPEYLFSVRFAAAEIWGDSAEPAATVSADLFDRYLEPV